MKYRVALLQNQSEAFELSYGDVYSWFSKTFNEYEWDLYSTEQSMKILFEKMDNLLYDAIVFTTNTFNDIYLHKAWSKQGKRISRFLEKGKGILVFQQIKLEGKKIDMLPEDFMINIVKRPMSQENKDCNINLATDHLMLHYPNEINLSELMKDCLQDIRIEYVYLSYLVPDKPEQWLEILVDDNQGNGQRPLLLTTGPQINGRLVITSLVLDWQRQLIPLKNIVSFVVEGPHNMAVVRRSGKTSYDFEYLLYNLRIAKHSFREYQMEALNFDVLHPCIHDIIILDPAWSSEMITKNKLEMLRSKIEPGTLLVQFGVDLLGEPTITTSGGRIPFLKKYRPLIIYLRNSFDPEGGRWDGSYFSTIHVLDVFKQFGEPLEEYKDAFLKYIQPHVQDGSYDQQFAATCALLKVYHLFLGNKDTHFKKSLSWINKELKIKHKADGDLARAYLALKNCGIDIEIDVVKKLARRVDPKDSDSEEEAFRYATIFFAYGFIEEVVSWVSHLIHLQQEDGSWGHEERNRLFLTALMVDLLLSVKEMIIIKGGNIPKIDEAILMAVIYLKSFNLISLPERNKASTIATVLRAIQHFENKIRFPIDNFLEKQVVDSKEFRAIQRFDIVNNLISKIQSDKVYLSREFQKTIYKLMKSRRLATSLIFSIMFSILLISALAYIIIKISIEESAVLVFAPLVTLAVEHWPYIIPILLLVLLIILVRRRLISRRLIRMLRTIISLKTSPETVIEENNENKQN